MSAATKSLKLVTASGVQTLIELNDVFKTLKGFQLTHVQLILTVGFIASVNIDVATYFELLLSPDEQLFLIVLKISALNPLIIILGGKENERQLILLVWLNYLAFLILLVIVNEFLTANHMFEILT